MKTEQIKKGMTSTGSKVLSTGAGVVTATLAKKMLAGKVPVPGYLLNAALGAGLVAFSTTQKAKSKEVLEYLAVGHGIVAVFDAANNFKVPHAPMINGMRGMRGLAGRGMGYYGNSNSAITAGEPTMRLTGVQDDEMFVHLSGMEEAAAKQTFDLY